MKINKVISSHKSWQELNKTLEKYTKSNQAKLAGDIFELVVKLYLQVSPVYKTKLKKVYSKNSDEWKGWPDFLGKK